MVQKIIEITLAQIIIVCAFLLFIAGYYSKKCNCAANTQPANAAWTIDTAATLGFRDTGWTYKILKQE